MAHCPGSATAPPTPSYRRVRLPPAPCTQYGRGEVSHTRLMVFVAYGSCAYDILAVTVGILSGGNVLNLFAAWGDAGFGEHEG